MAHIQLYLDINNQIGYAAAPHLTHLGDINGHPLAVANICNGTPKQQGRNEGLVHQQ